MLLAAVREAHSGRYIVILIAGAIFAKHNLVHGGSRQDMQVIRLVCEVVTGGIASGSCYGVDGIHIRPHTDIRSRQVGGIGLDANGIEC